MSRDQGARPLYLNLFLSLRPGQWTKNLFVFGALVFAHRLTDGEAVLRAIAAFLVFCALSGAIYLVNDVLGLYAVADGVGGSEAGEVASRIAVDTIAGAMPSSAALVAASASLALSMPRSSVRSPGTRTT